MLPGTSRYLLLIRPPRNSGSTHATVGAAAADAVVEPAGGCWESSSRSEPTVATPAGPAPTTRAATLWARARATEKRAMAAGDLVADAYARVVVVVLAVTGRRSWARGRGIGGRDCLCYSDSSSDGWGRRGEDRSGPPSLMAMAGRSDRCRSLILSRGRWRARTAAK